MSNVWIFWVRISYLRSKQQSGCSDRHVNTAGCPLVIVFILPKRLVCRQTFKLKINLKMLSNFYKDCKEDLVEGEVLVVMDFAENYSFVVQDEVQSFHWNNTMVTLHPFEAYFKENGKLSNLNFVVISECNIHETVSVHLFLKYFHE